MEVIEDILKTADNPFGANKTKLVYMSNLNFTRLSHFLDYLLEKGLLEKNDGGNTYMLSAKGREFLKQLKKMQDLV
jgi:predicted transcriptional regulator